MRKKIETENRLVAPGMATMLLKNRHGNRPINEFKARSYAGAMERGEWVIGEAIMLSNESRMMDGQHRMRGVEIAEIPIRFIFNIGFAYKETYDSIGQGMPRSKGQILSGDEELYPELSPRQCNNLAAALAYQWRFEVGLRNPVQTLHPAKRPTASQIHDLAYKHPGLCRSVKTASYKACRLLGHGLTIFFHYQFGIKDQILADEFIDDLGTGTGLSDGDGLYMLRERLLRNKASKKVKLTATEICALTVKAWNAERASRPVLSLRFRSSGDRSEKFPVIE